MESAVDQSQPRAPGSKSSPPGEQRNAWQLQWAQVAEKWALPALFVVMVAIFAVTASGFWTGENIRVVIGTQAPLVILSVAAMMPLVVGQFDLSVAAIAGTAGIAMVTTITRFHAPLGVGILVALVISGLIGLFNGAMVSFVNLNAFIVTLGVSTVLQGVVQGYTGGSVLAGTNIGALETSLSGNAGGIPKGVFWFLPVALVMWYLIEQTPFGRHLRSIGSNNGAAQLLGIRRSRWAPTCCPRSPPPSWAPARSSPDCSTWPAPCLPSSSSRSWWTACSTWARSRGPVPSSTARCWSAR
jgi:ribose transport system permease protein